MEKQVSVDLRVISVDPIVFAIPLAFSMIEVMINEKVKVLQLGLIAAL